ncbi:HAMP domain-containing protein [Pedobacter petrophilus]|uniref:histidine kinase n=1 Tax=Pedobacter petrophilus TaxID=1908241 RepID=A0A7K0FXL9_9SPHI|nr:ATP-binding protein [Pedobacter petrophilus]MRX76275.1 HAMP domain-containing protein [Pedobacter petrophilus]
MNSYFYRGLRFRMTALFSLIFMVINLAFGRIIYQYFKNNYVENYNKYLYSRGQSILDKTEINPDIIALPDSGESIRVFYHNNEDQPVKVFQSPGTISRLAVPYRTSLVDSLGEYGVYLKKEDYDGRPVELLLTVSDAPLKHKLNQFSHLMIGITAVSLVLSALFAFLASIWLMNPIRFIARQAEGINTDRLGERIKYVKTHDELQQLAQTINDMIGRIEQEQQARNVFFAAASHELQTPLANLRAETELELMGRTSKADQELLSSQLAEISRLQAIVEQFLLISEFNNSGIALRKSTVDLSDQLLRVFSRNIRQIQSRNIKHHIQFSEQLNSFDCHVDGDKMEMVWQNLLQNALKYSPAGGSLFCSVTTAENRITISFENSISQDQIPLTGLGIPFKKGATVTSGSGLGLWLCTIIVQAHQGEIQLESKNHFFKVSVSLPH